MSILRCGKLQEIKLNVTIITLQKCVGIIWLLLLSTLKTLHACIKFDEHMIQLLQLLPNVLFFTNSDYVVNYLVIFSNLKLCNCTWYCTTLSSWKYNTYTSNFYTVWVIMLSTSTFTIFCLVSCFPCICTHNKLTFLSHLHCTFKQILFLKIIQFLEVTSY